MRRTVILALPAAVLLTACGDVGTNKALLPPPPLQAAKDSCAAGVTTDAEVQDEGKSLSLHMGQYASYTATADPTQLSPDGLICILNATHTPDYVRNQISNTRALDGMQNATWTGFRAQWTYHPDAGLNMTLIQQ